VNEQSALIDKYTRLTQEGRYISFTRASLKRLHAVCTHANNDAHTQFQLWHMNMKLLDAFMGLAYNNQNDRVLVIWNVHMRCTLKVHPHLPMSLVSKIWSLTTTST
jgi:hypothetical protein